MNRRFVLVTVLSLSTLAGALACSGAGSSPPFADGETPAPAGSLSPAPTPPDDAGTSAAPTADAALPSTPSPALLAATGTLLAAAEGIELLGVTDDGFVAFASGSTVQVAPIAGGPGAFIGEMPARARAWVSGPAVFTQSGDIGPVPGLSVWTHAHGNVHLSSGPVAAGPIVASPDGTRAAFFSTPAVLTVALLDGTHAESLGTACTKALAFDAQDDLVSANCPAPSASVSVFAAPGYERTILAADAAYAIDPKGAWLWIVGGDGSGELVRASDGTTVLRAASVAGSALFDGAGASLFYVADGALMGVRLASPSSVTTIVPDGVTSLRAVSPDGKAVVYDSAGGVFVRSTDANAYPNKLVGPDAVGGDFTFTSDSSEVLFLTSSVPLSYFAFSLGRPVPVVAGGEVTSVTLLAGTKALTIDASNDGHVIDLAGKAATVDLPQMGAFAVSSDRKTVAYVADGVTVPGLYVVAAGG
jgi:hypothetical protein